MKNVPILSLTVPIALVFVLTSCGKQESLAKKAVAEHGVMIQELLAYNESKRSVPDFAADPKMLGAMDAIATEVKVHQAPKEWESLQGDKLREAIYKDSEEVRYIFTKRQLNISGMESGPWHDVWVKVNRYFLGFIQIVDTHRTNLANLEIDRRS